MRENGLLQASTVIQGKCGIVRNYTKMSLFGITGNFSAGTKFKLLPCKFRNIRIFITCTLYIIRTIKVIGMR